MKVDSNFQLYAPISISKWGIRLLYYRMEGVELLSCEQDRGCWRPCHWRRAVARINKKDKKKQHVRCAGMIQLMYFIIYA